jgi:hypothetical protein
MIEFQRELETLINKHSIDNDMRMPDFLLAEMICEMLQAMSPSFRRALDWHGCGPRWKEQNTK